MDLTLFIILVILSFILFTFLLSMKNDIEYIKGFFEEIKKPKIKENKSIIEVVDIIKEIFFNYLRK
jgi:hypothetical protein